MSKLLLIKVAGLNSLLKLVNGIGAILVSNCEQNMLFSKSQQILYRKRISMLLNKIFQMHLRFLPRLWLKIQKMSHLWHFNYNNFGNKHDNYTNEPIFVIYSFTSSPWYISFLHLKTFNIQFHMESPFLYYVPVCKIYIYMTKTTPSNLLTQISFFYIKVANFWYIICFLPNLISIWPRTHELK